MPLSTNYFKKETIDFILKNFNKNSRILDVGPGVGTYSQLLQPHGYTNMDCVEIFEPYVVQYNLSNKYKNVFIGDICDVDINFDDYDLIIFGDVLEHISLDNSKRILDKINLSSVIIAVPFLSPQGEHFGNIHETHLQEDLTFVNFFERFPKYFPFALRHDYGIFVDSPQNKIYIETSEKKLPEPYTAYIEYNYSHITLKNVSDDETVLPDKIENNNNNNNTTIVTALWDLGRGNIDEAFKRSYSQYLSKFAELLKTDVPMYIFIDPSDEEFIWQHRKRENTVINKMSLKELKEWFNFTKQTNEIRIDESWLSQASWLRESPQAKLDAYNPVVMSKMFMLNNVTIWNPFNTEYFFWIDAGITSTVNPGYFTHDKVFDKLPDFLRENKEFVFLTYPYDGGTEIHGFERTSIARYCNTDYVNYVCRGGFFGGKKEKVNVINGIYYHYLNSSLAERLMGTEESIFTIVLHNNPKLITQFMIGSDGLIWRFFEDIKDGNFHERVLLSSSEISKKSNVALYVMSFNSPRQLQTLIDSMYAYDENFVINPQWILLDNSTDLSTQPEYINICEEHNIIHIKKDNLGICGGRQFIAEHAEESGYDFYFFFEDDMFFYPKKGEICKNGFNRWVPNLYEKSLEIISNNSFDFLKLSFTEFFGDNKTQWSWYNVPQSVREDLWPEKPNLPKHGLDPNPPKTKFNNIYALENLPFVDGEIYYSNWPQVVSRAGNKKMFLETTWAHPYEQTWMSYMYQETKKGNIKPALLLLTPTEHNRFDHYDGKLRKES